METLVTVVSLLMETNMETAIKTQIKVHQILIELTKKSFKKNV